MTQDYILVSPTPSACLKPGNSSDLRPSLGLRPSDLGDAAALTAPRHSQQKKCAFLPSTSLVLFGSPLPLRLGHKTPPATGPCTNHCKSTGDFSFVPFQFSRCLSPQALTKNGSIVIKHRAGHPSTGQITVIPTDKLTAAFISILKSRKVLKFQSLKNFSFDVNQTTIRFIRRFQLQTCRPKSLPNSPTFFILTTMNLRALILFAALPLLADGPADNLPEKVRPVPPPGIKIHDEDRADLTKQVEELRAKIKSVPTNKTPSEVADVWIFHHAVDYALRYDEFLSTNDVRTAERLLRIGHEKADGLLREPQPKSGGGILGTAFGNLAVHGYTSKIDDSIQPYGLVIPSSYYTSPDRPRRLDAWFHGRDEKLTELKFLNDRLKSPGEFTPPDTFVLHLYGRDRKSTRLNSSHSQISYA